MCLDWMLDKNETQKRVERKLKERNKTLERVTYRASKRAKKIPKLISANAKMQRVNTKNNKLSYQLFQVYNILISHSQALLSWQRDLIMSATIENRVSFFNKIACIFSSITLEPVIFCLVFTGGLMAFITQNLIIDKVCRLHHNS